MTRPPARSRRRWGRVAVAAGVSLVVAAVLLSRSGAVVPKRRSISAPRAAARIVPLFGKTTPAATKAHLTLASDSRKVVGWISGREGHAGREVTVAAGEATGSVMVQWNNTFTWYYRVPKATVATFTIGKLSRRITLRPPEESAPSVFFVVDRTAYRPGHQLQFAGFLRKLSEAGRFVPLAGKEVEVLVRSVKKKTTAAKIKLTSDAFGRISGSYRFSREDPLDEYTLSIKDYRGQATVKLAEFRKAKVRLDISGRREGDKLRLRFEARDFLNKPVPAERVQFTARVFRRRTLRKTRALKAEEFVYFDGHSRWLPDPEELTDEQLYRWAYEGVWPQTQHVMVAQVSRQIKLNGEPRGEHDVPLKRGWLDGGSLVQVEAVLVDQNGREQRATKSISLAKDDSPQRRDLVVELPKRLFCSREPIPVTVRVFDAEGKPCDVPANTAVVAMRKLHVPTYSPLHRYSSTALPMYQYNSLRSAAAYPQWQGRYRGSIAYPWVTVGGGQRDVGQLVTATAARDGKASVHLTDPGVYNLVAITHLPDGRTLREQTSCTVLAEEAHGLVLRLDRTAYEPGEEITGEIHSRFRDAGLLLTLRDSRGIRLWRTLKLDGSVMRLRQRLPRDLNYGCSLVVQYVDDDGGAHTAHKAVRVKPTDRMLKIETTMEEVVEPGKPMKLHFKVNRNEPVDLVVSVYDQSLLGIARNKSPNIRNFYLADERAFGQTALDLLRRKLGDVTLAELIQRAKEVLKTKPKRPVSSLATVTARLEKGNYVNLSTLVSVLHFAGLTARHYPRSHSWYYRWDRKGPSPRIADMLAHKQGHWRLSYRFYHDLLVITEASDRHDQRSYPVYNPYYGYSSMRRARGDAHYSMSANSMMSVSAQSFISHLPMGMGPSAQPLLPDTPSVKGAVRRDFSDSAFWKACVRTDDRGEATVEFKLPDSLTNWHVVATAVSGDMHVGHHTDSFRTYKPIMVWPMIPRVFTHGDKVRVFARVHNRTDAPQTIRTKLKVHNGNVLDRDTVHVTVKPKDSAAVYWTFEPGDPGFTQLLMTAECDAGADASLKRLPVVPACSVVQLITASGFCKDAAAFTVPKDALDGFGKLEVTVVPSLAGDMVDTLDYLVTYPHGCVEQTMSRFLPAIKVAQILKVLGIRHKPLEKKLPGCVQAGIKRLLQLQRKDGGWGWNGNGRTHEMMTPYALYGLLEAEAAGYDLPAEDAVQRGLQRLKGFIDAMGEKAAADRIYCMYVYTLRKPMAEAWWQFIDAQLKKNRLSDYAIAMALEMAVRQGRKDLAKALAAQLRKRACPVGEGVRWRTAGFSRWGNDPYEITAAAFKALVAFDPDDELVPRILAYFASTKRGKRWNSTKDTALVLFAMCDYLAAKKIGLPKDSKVALSLNDHHVGELALKGGLVKKMSLPIERVRPGRNVVRFGSAAPGAMYRLVYTYHKVGREVPPFASGVRVTRRFFLHDRAGKQVRQIKPGESIPRGSYIRSEVDIRNLHGASMSYVLVECPKPSCSEIVPAADKRFPQASSRYVLREDKTAGVLYHHESAGNHMIDRCVFHAELAGEYVVPPAYVELMYKTDVRGHSGTFRFNVAEDPKVQ